MEDVNKTTYVQICHLPRDLDVEIIYLPRLISACVVLEYLELFTFTVYILGGGGASGINWIFNDIS